MAEYPILTPRLGYAELDPEQWWRATTIASVSGILGGPTDIFGRPSGTRFSTGLALAMNCQATFIGSLRDERRSKTGTDRFYNPFFRFASGSQRIIFERTAGEPLAEISGNVRKTLCT
jgi:hypothetical protein